MMIAGPTDIALRVKNNYDQIRGFLELLWMNLCAAWARGHADLWAKRGQSSQQQTVTETTKTVEVNKPAVPPTGGQ
jgi:hypothetical protein